MPLTKRAKLNDATVYEDDASTLQPGRWLNDAIITYLFERFGSQPMQSGGSVVLLEPATTFTAAMVGDPFALREMFGVRRGAGVPPLTEQLAAASIVLMPVNNNEDAGAVGGGHWSLLVFRRRGGEGGQPRFEHYDSCDQANAPNARAVMAALAQLLFGDTKIAKLQLVRMSTPQQANGFDCGVYALAIAEILSAAPAEGGAPPAESVTEAVRALTPEAVTAKRKAWLELLSGAMEEPPEEPESGQ